MVLWHTTIVQVWAVEIAGGFVVRGRVDGDLAMCEVECVEARLQCKNHLQKKAVAGHNFWAQLPTDTEGASGAWGKVTRSNTVSAYIAKPIRNSALCSRQ